jgi:hypothetical protein
MGDDNALIPALHPLVWGKASEVVKIVYIQRDSYNCNLADGE